MSGGNSYEFRPFTEEEAALMKRFQSANNVKEYMHVGPKGYVLPTTFQQLADDIRNMPLRDTDTFVVSYPRSGTTWTQELVWLLANDLDFDKAKSIPIPARYPFLESYMNMQPFLERKLKNEPNFYTEWLKLGERFKKPAAEVLAGTPSPRFIKSHLPLSLLPTGTLDTARVVYVARDPRDVAVSYYFFLKSLLTIGRECEFKEFYYEEFSKDLSMWSPYFEHVKEAWSQRDHPNLLFIQYEELSNDLIGTAKRISSFLGMQYTDQQLQPLPHHLSFDNFQKNMSVILENLRKMGYLDDTKQKFFRKGKVGGWREYFDPEMEQHAARWIADNLAGTGLSFQD